MNKAVASMEDDSFFAVLAVFPESYISTEPHGSSISAGDGVILLFDIYSPAPAATWLVKEAKGGGSAFLHLNKLYSLEETNSSERPTTLLAYISKDHEYVVFDPLSKEQHKLNVNCKKDALNLEEAEQSGYASIYGVLPHFNPKKTTQARIMLSEHPWDTIFSGPSHTLPPLKKLCSAFLESLLEKRLAATG